MSFGTLEPPFGVGEPLSVNHVDGFEARLGIEKARLPIEPCDEAWVVRAGVDVHHEYVSIP